MHKNATKCNETIGKWCKNKHGASKIIDTFETYQSPLDITCKLGQEELGSLDTVSGGGGLQGQLRERADASSDLVAAEEEVVGAGRSSRRPPRAHAATSAVARAASPIRSFPIPLFFLWLSSDLLTQVRDSRLDGTP
jgi:hypothetical protein